MKRRLGEAFKKYRDRLKNESDKIKDYLKGRLIKGTEVEYSGKSFGRWNIHRTDIQRKSKKKEYRKHRKIRNRMARKSRRINRLRAA